jgi:hypothetical protein
MTVTSAPGALRATAENRVAAITAIYAHGSTFPCQITTEAGHECVMKLRGSGPGPMALLTELLALRAAEAMGLAVPSARPLYLPPDFPWTIGSDEFDGIVQRSFGWNLGIAFVPHATTAQPAEVLGADPAFLDALVAVDSALSNMDRTTRNPNVLKANHGLVAIDFDACLFLRRAARDMIPSSFSLPPGHLLSGRENTRPGPAVDPAVLTEALRDAPEEWLTVSGLAVGTLADALAAYMAAWNTR